MIFKSLTKNFYINLIFIFLIFILDRISKVYVIYLNEKSYTSEIFSSKFLNISLTWNQGIAFGLFSFDQSDLYNFLTIIIFIVIFFIFIMIIKNKGFKRYALIMIFGGAIGNLFDRIFFKAVPDFIDFHFHNFHWFSFNIADIFISLGIIFMLINEFGFKNKKNEN